MNLGLTGKRVFVTGGTKGLAKQLPMLLLQKEPKWLFVQG